MQGMIAVGNVRGTAFHRLCLACAWPSTWLPLAIAAFTEWGWLLVQSALRTLSLQCMLVSWWGELGL